MKTGSKILAFALLFVGLLLVNYLASSLPVRLDTTAESLYTLSPGTKALLEKVDDQIQVDLYFSKSSESVPVTYKNYAVRVEEMLRQYVRSSKGKLHLNVIDPRPDTPSEEKATAAGLTPQMLSTGEKVYFGLVATLADQQKQIPVLSTQREQFLEYDLSQLIYSVQQVTKKKLGLITSLPLQGSQAMPMMRKPAQPGQAILTEWEKTFEVVSVEAGATELPANLEALAVIHPQNLSPKLQYAIDQFILAGKPTFIAVDPASQHFKNQANPNNMYGPQPGVSSDLPALFKAYGIGYDPQSVVGDLRNSTQVQTGAGGIVSYPVWISLTKGSFGTGSISTAQLKSMLLIEAGSLDVQTTADVKVTPLIETSEKSGTVATMALQFAAPETLANQIKPSGKKTLAALLQGKFKTAFPNGAPEDDKPKDPKAPPTPTPAPSAPGLKESTSTSTLVVASDTDWLTDTYSVRRMNFLGVSAAEPINDNLAFASNTLELLAGSQDLISLRGKGSSLRPFTVVKEMEIAANEKYQEKLQSLETRLADVQKQLNELQGKKGAGNRLVATPEVQKAIDDFHKQEASMRAERRKIRLALREDIEALGNRLLLINLLVGPIGLIVFFIWFQSRRRNA